MKYRGLLFLSILFSAALLMLTGCIDQVDEGPPTTTILNPANGDIVRGTVPVIVTAYDEKDVERIRVFIDGAQVLEEESDIATFNWETGPLADNRNHFVAAYAIDDDGNVGPSAITSVQVFALAVDTLPQLVTIQNPQNTHTVSGIVNIAVGVSRDDNNPIDSVAIYVDGVRRTTDTTFPYIYPWDTTNLIDGSLHTIFAIAYDRIGFNVTSNVNTVSIASDNIGNITAPIATIENPLHNQTVSGLTNVVANVSNIEFNSVDSVLFLVDGVRSYTSTTYPYIFPWNTSALSNGSRHTIFAVVFDQLGFNVSSDVVSVTVSSNVTTDPDAPVVTIIFPDPSVNNIFSKSALGNSVTVVADAQDVSGVTNVEFYIDGILQGSDTTPLYEYTWDLSSYVTGIDHTIFVRAFDPSGNVGAAFARVRLEP